MPPKLVGEFLGSESVKYDIQHWTESAVKMIVTIVRSIVVGRSSTHQGIKVDKKV